MNEAGHRTTPEPGRATKSGAGRRFLVLLVVAVVAFLIGFGWQFMRARELAGRLQVVEREATFARLGTTLANAALEAQAGSYERARQLSSEFFSGLQSEIDRATTGSRAELDAILASRDDVITMLSRANPQSAQTLAAIYNRYGAAVGVATATPDTAPPAVAPADTTAPMRPDTSGDTAVTTTGS